METKALVYRNWDDLVFENRNKEYGAYVIRRSYNEKVISGWLVTLFVIGGLLAFFTFSDNPQVREVKGVVLAGTIGFTLPPPPAPKPPVRERAPAVSAPRQNTQLPPLVTTQVVPDAPVEPEIVDPGLQSVPSTSGGGVITDVLPIPGEQSTVVVPVPPIRTVAEVMPEYKGGYNELIKFLSRNVRFPASARRQRDEGTVYVSFVVNGDGSVTEVKVVRGFQPDCDKEAVRVIGLLSDWKGGRQNGVPVGVRMVLPIKFQLN